jgi:hypothetical protein
MSVYWDGDGEFFLRGQGRGAILDTDGRVEVLEQQCNSLIVDRVSG